MSINTYVYIPDFCICIWILDSTQNISNLHSKMEMMNHINLIIYLKSKWLNRKWGFPRGSVVNNMPVNAGDMGLISGSGRCPGGGNGKPLPWRITWTEEPGMQQSMESQRIRHDLATQSVQSLSCVWIFLTLWTAARQASLSITNSWSLLKLISIESVMPSNYLILCHPLLLLPSISHPHPCPSPSESFQ